MPTESELEGGVTKHLDTRAFVGLVVVAILAVTALLLRYQQAGFGAGEVTIGDNLAVAVEVAASDATRERGLSGRNRLETGHGVLFLFAQPAKYSFWMKDMRFPIDAIWIRDGKIVDLSIGIQPPQTDEEVPLSFSPIEAADAVLEVPAGFAAEHGLRLDLPVTYRIDRRGALR
jgi:hypothetical protein